MQRKNIIALIASGVRQRVRAHMPVSARDFSPSEGFPEGLASHLADRRRRDILVLRRLRRQALRPFVFVRAVRAFFDGPLVLAGGIGDGHALRAAQALGCDLAYMGTKFIATAESMADPRYKEMLVASSADDILLTTAFTGLQTNMLRPSISAAGLDPDDLPQRGPIDIARDIDIGGREGRPARWRDIWSAGQSTSGVTGVFPVDRLVATTIAEYRAAPRAG